MYVVAGATGSTGSLVANALLERGQPVRVLVRNEAAGASWRERGAEVARVDFDEGSAALTEALRGCEGAWLLVPTPPSESTGVLARCARWVDVMGEALTASRLPHAVVLSSMGAHQAEGTGIVQTLNVAERKLGALGTPVTFVRAAFFMENWFGYGRMAMEQGVVPSCLSPAERKLPMVAVRDVAAACARLLLEPTPGRRVLELSGPADYSLEDVAEAMGRAVQRQVRPLVSPLDTQVERLISFGSSREMAELFNDHTRAMNSGQALMEGGGVPRERGPTSLEEAFEPLARRARQARGG